MSDNLPSMHRAACQRWGARVALRYKCDGLYRDLSWSTYRQHVECGAGGLIDLGIAPGDRIAILSENRYEWMEADYAILAAGAVNVPLHAPLAARQVEYQVAHSEARGLMISGECQAEKIREVIAGLPNLEFLISFDPIDPVPGVQTLTWGRLKQRGAQLGAAGRAEVLRREAAITSDDLATIIYTSGTTGQPKGVMLTHGNLLTNAAATAQSSLIQSSDILLSWLPYSHIYARTVDHYLTTLVGVTVALAESVDTLVANLRDIQPTWMTAVPRFYEKIWMSVEQLPPKTQYDTMHGIFGPRLRHLSSGGAPLPRHVCEGFFECDIPLLEGYGLTESSPVISFNSPNGYKIGSVGRALCDVEIRIDDDGEILTRGPHVMKGYWKNPEATAETIVDGWLRTGDVGELDPDGFLTITDRKKDLIITSAGKNIAPSEVERLLVSDPYIDQAVIYGDGRQFVSALIVPNFENLQKKVSELGCTLETDGEFIVSRPIQDFLKCRIDMAMRMISQPERVKKFLLLGRPFQLDADELTATLKVRRRHIIQKYSTELSGLYGDSE